MGRYIFKRFKFGMHIFYNLLLGINLLALAYAESRRLVKIGKFVVNNSKKITIQSGV